VTIFGAGAPCVSAGFAGRSKNEKLISLGALSRRVKVGKARNWFSGVGVGTIIMAEHATRPPSYLSCASLARELDVAESTVYELVNRGILPKPIKLSSGCTRWCWDDVTMALASLKAGATVTEIDPYIRGARDATKEE